MNIYDLDKCDVLIELFNAARPPKLMGLFLVYPTILTRDQAEKALKATGHIEKLHGRVLKINLDWRTLDAAAYDKVNGEQCARHAIDRLRSRMQREQDAARSRLSSERDDRARTTVNDEPVFVPIAVSGYEPRVESRHRQDDVEPILSGGGGNFGGGGATGRWDDSSHNEPSPARAPSCSRAAEETTTSRYEAPAPTPERYESSYSSPSRSESASSSWGSSETNSSSSSSSYSSDTSSSDSSSSCSSD